MLRNIHKASSTWLGKTVMAVVMGFLVISFAIWGIGDIFRGGFGRNDVASIGSTEISIEQFRQFYNDKLQQLSRQVRRAITPEQARGMGLDRQFLGELIAQVTLDEQARKMHLGLSNAEIAERIRNDPAFRGPNGQFDRTRFEQLIRDAGYSEPRFVAEQRGVMLRRQIAQTVAGDLPVPSIAVAALNRFRNERRDIDYLALGPAQAGDIPAPSPEQLSKFYDEHKAQFRAPEYRKITLLPLSPADLAKPDQISDADAQKYYEQHKDQFGRPEKRELHQMVFPDAAQAAAAREQIQKGESFQQVAEKRGLKPSDTDIGLVTQKQIVDPAVAEAAFKLPPNQVSEPIKGRFGTVLLLVTKIEPGEQQSFQQAEAQIKQSLAEQRARNAIGDLRDKVEDERASGATLAETARKLGLKAVAIDAVDRAGRAPNGQPVAELKNFPPNVINSAFSSDVGVDNEAISLPSGGYLYYEVNGITPSHDRKLDEVKNEVEARWRADQIADRLQKQAEQMLGKLKAGTPLQQVASEHGLAVQKAADLQRGKPGGVPESVDTAAFKTGKGGVGMAQGNSETEQYIFQVAQVTDPVTDAVQGQELKQVLQNSYADDLVGEYLARLENEYGVSINQSAVNQVVGGTTEQQ
jgi:peptidyl-prolyl cis-trans isomerase D